MSRREVVVRDLDASLDAEWAEAALDEAFGGRWQARRGRLHDVLRLPGLVAEAAAASRSGTGASAVSGRGPERIGLLLYDPDDGHGEAELAALATPVRGAGGGTALVRALFGRLPDRAIWVVTTNDNLDALRFYQRLGFRLRAVRPGAVDEARRLYKPAIPVVGRDGIPLRDELELVRPPGQS